jgi:hypothetical protein
MQGNSSQHLEHCKILQGIIIFIWIDIEYLMLPPLYLRSLPRAHGILTYSLSGNSYDAFDCDLIKVSARTVTVQH